MPIIRPALRYGGLFALLLWVSSCGLEFTTEPEMLNRRTPRTAADSCLNAAVDSSEGEESGSGQDEISSDQDHQDDAGCGSPATTAAPMATHEDPL